MTALHIKPCGRQTVCRHSLQPRITWTHQAWNYIEVSQAQAPVSRGMALQSVLAIYFTTQCPKIWQLGTGYIYYLTQSLRARSSLTGQVWLRVSHEVAVKLQTRTAIILRLHWDQKICFQDAPHVAAGRRPQFLATWASPQSCLCCHNMVSSTVSDLKEKARRKLQCLVLEVTYHERQECQESWMAGGCHGDWWPLRQGTLRGSPAMVHLWTVNTGRSRTGFPEVRPPIFIIQGIDFVLLSRILG